MVTIKNCCYLMVVLCFLSASSSLHYSLAEETSKETISDEQNGKGNHEKASAQNYPQISLESAQYDAGEVYEGDVIAHDFIVKNTGTAQLDISDVKPGEAVPWLILIRPFLLVRRVE